jgi:hypothetical protein
MPAPARDQSLDELDDDIDAPRAGGRRQARDNVQDFEIKVGGVTQAGHSIDNMMNRDRGM